MHANELSASPSSTKVRTQSKSSIAPKTAAAYYGPKGKFCRFALAGGLVHQAITVSTHSTMNTHVFLSLGMLSLRLDNIYIALMYNIYQVVQLFRRDGVSGFF